MAELVVPSRSSVDKAGRVLRDPNATVPEFQQALATLSRWRSLHTYPIDAVKKIFSRRLNKKAYPDAIIAQRLKRFNSIVDKLDRYPDMSLAKMQDIGGLRVVLSSVSDVYKLHNMVLHDSAHEAILPPKDYIHCPKADGYRSLHQVFKYKSRDYPQLDGMRIEVQLRSKLQHAWATAVETFDIIERSSLKTGGGNSEARRFFYLAGALFAHDEKTNLPDEISSTSPRILIEEILDIEARLHVGQKISGLAHTIKHLFPNGKPGAHLDGYYLVELNLQEGSIQMIPFTSQQSLFATKMYSLNEQDAKGKEDISVVLLNAGSIRGIRKAYPNYFLDTHSFLKNLERVCAAYKQ